MSLLMKALEKAAKDRNATGQPAPTPEPVTPAPSAPPGSGPIPTRGSKPIPSAPSKLELSLEPLPSDTPPEPVRTLAPSTASGKSSPGTKAGEQQARAAAVLQATATSSPPPAATARRFKPVVAASILAAIAVIGFGIYVYLQITNPGLFIRQPPLTAKPPLAQAPSPAVQPPIATSTLVAPAEPAGAPGAATPITAVVQTAPPTPAAARARTEAPSDSIKVSTGTAEPQLDPRLNDAYAALQSGKLDAARQIYADMVRSDPKNIQALLGAAAVAMQQNGADEASRLYFRVLDLEPRNTYAQAGIVALMGRADPAAAEAKLKQLIAREPLASLHFTLGNLYGDQSRWAEAQQSYFQAHHLEPGNPDYAYNLAVGLEHVGQTKLAAGFYRRAVELAQARGRAGFNVNRAQDRIRQLAALPE
jgi:tetratricopeptide (TPR) repeat protein